MGVIRRVGHIKNRFVRAWVFFGILCEKNELKLN